MFVSVHHLTGAKRREGRDFCPNSKCSKAQVGVLKILFVLGT
jgi:hypothetical protein